MIINKIGIMQGRLSKPVNGKIQAFPWDSWKEEFDRGKQIGLDSIEFIYESFKAGQNPLMTTEGRRIIRRLCDKNHLVIDHVCADYFMEIPLIRTNSLQRKTLLNIISNLFECCADLNIKGVEIPMVDNSSIHTAQEMEEFIDTIKIVLHSAEKHSIEIGLETDLAPDAFKDLLSEIDHPLIKANYDIGNSASSGFDTREEIITLGKWITNVHIKDRILRGGTVPFGTGNANFDRSFKALKEINYVGPLILQAARSDDEMKTVAQQLNVVQSLRDRYLTNSIR